MWAGWAAGCVLLQCLSLATWGQGIAMAWPHTARSEAKENEVLSLQGITLCLHIHWEFVLFGEKLNWLIKKNYYLFHSIPKCAGSDPTAQQQRGESSDFSLSLSRWDGRASTQCKTSKLHRFPAWTQ